MLVIDDEVSIGRSIQRMLRAHDVALLVDGETALATLRDGELPDLVLCDLMMPGRSGMELYTALAECRPEALGRIVFMTGGSYTADSDRFLSEHPVRVIAKPFEVGALEALVASSLPLR